MHSPSLLFAALIGQTLGLTVLAFAIAHIGLHHPTDPTPLRGRMWQLFGRIWVVSLVLVVFEKIIMAQLPQDQQTDIPAVFLLVSLIVIGRWIAHGMAARHGGTRQR